MESDFQHHHHHLLDHYQQQQQKQLNSGLMRYQSAPSSLFSSLLDREFCEEFFNRPSSPETERIFARFLSSSGGDNGGGNTEVISDAVRQNSLEKEVEVKVEPETQMMAPMNSETAVMQQQQQPQPQPQPQPQQGNYSSVSQNFYQGQPRPHPHTSSAMEYNMTSSMGMDRLPPMKTGGGSNSNLIRHSSSPAGLFANIHVENGYSVMRNVADFGGGKTENREPTFHSASRPPPSPLLTPIPEIGSKNVGANSSENVGYGENRQNSYSTGFPTGSWEESAMMSDNMSRRLGEEDRTLSSEIQNVDTGNRPPPILAHHLSLQKASGEMSTIEKFFQLQDSVPCKIRAKRGCATHPRSIAERVRRTKISERMRKLQDLVPNMDKQTNTADMLDLAVEYIKDLQKQVKTLSDSRAKCRCGINNKQQ
ncbi:hypothetical protein SLEP1_g32111 [Rubroshorea leprosula]|uniref:BHLH domain-containing protein n=1 Tax=Rubroshorea leprosula TaxID=152421 RepID=A0AAV5KCB6_9ROSI|nr:hypothetical protein SLEP1_g32111 [Rubroshorea leprosula]